MGGKVPPYLTRSPAKEDEKNVVASCPEVRDRTSLEYEPEEYDPYPSR